MSSMQISPCVLNKLQQPGILPPSPTVIANETRLFFRKQKPGHLMLRIPMTDGQTNAEQFRVIADLTAQYGKGFCYITTGQQILMRWFTIGDLPDIWQRLAKIGLSSEQYGMDDFRNVCGCPVAGLKKHELDHLGIHPQMQPALTAGPQLYYAGLMVPVGRITTSQMRGVADLAERYGDGQMRLSVHQNIIVPNIQENRLGPFSVEPVLKELPLGPLPLMREPAACTWLDHRRIPPIETGDWAIRVAKNLEEHIRGQRLAPLTIHMSDCSSDQ